ncbi:MAG: 4-hydroxy-tetrahydrodipicolinate synthase [Bacteroidota bacterium]|jgi:4-hydroxy-tetrahydrodipicolinate synthase
MKNKNLPQGFIPVMLTPFHLNGAVDYQKLAELTDQYIQWGATGLFANCLSSEMFELNQQERLEVIQTVVKTSNGRVPVVATGTFGDTIEEMAEFSNLVWKLGVDAVIILNNLIVKESDSDEIFLKKLKHWMDLTPNVQFGFYECPVPYKRLISNHVLKTLLPSGRFIYHKDTSLSLSKIKEKVKESDGFYLGIYDAYMVNALNSLKAGVNGLSCIQGNYFPELVVWLCKHFDSLKHASLAEEIQQFFIDSMDIVHQAYPIAAKYVLYKRGFQINQYTRREVGELTESQMLQLDHMIIRGEELISKL